MNEIERVEAVVRAMIENGEIRRTIVSYYILNNLPVPAM